MDELMICKYNRCQKYLLDPILLPCLNNVCGSHVDELKQTRSNKQFICIVCDKKHERPNNGFISNPAFAKLIDLNWHLEGNRKEVSESMSKLKDEVQNYETLLENPNKFIEDFISTVSNQIILETRRMIDKIKNYSDEMLAKLKAYENECKENLENIRNLSQLHKTQSSNIKKGLHNLNNELRTPKIENRRIDKLLNESNELINVVKRNIFDYKNILTNNKKCFFEKFDSKCLFGFLRIDPYEVNEHLFNTINFKSSILTSTQSLDLIKLCEFGAHSQFYLIYQATRDGFSAQSFHSKCDGIPGTLTIIKVKGNSNVFGGFTNATWDDNWYVDDPKAFIFSLINKDNRQLKVKIEDSTNAIKSNGNYGPIFGGDIIISNNSNINQESYSNLGYHYKNDLYEFGTTEAKNYLAGSDYFSTEEIEVYKVFRRI